MCLAAKIKKFFGHRHYFVTIRTIWPYKEGWGVHCKGCGMILDTGLPREYAEEICRIENERSKVK